MRHSGGVDDWTEAAWLEPGAASGTVQHMECFASWRTRG